MTPLLPTEESSRRSELVHPFRVPHEVGGGDGRVNTREHLLEARVGVRARVRVGVGVRVRVLELGC